MLTLSLLECLRALFMLMHAPLMRRLTSYNRSLAATAHFMQAEDCMRMTENLGGLCMNCARTARTPGVGAADAGSQAHAGLRDRLWSRQLLRETSKLITNEARRRALVSSSCSKHQTEEVCDADQYNRLRGEVRSICCRFPRTKVLWSGHSERAV